MPKAFAQPGDHVRSARGGGRALLWIGAGVGLAWICFLAVVGLFGTGRLDPDWRTVLIFVGIAALPTLIAVLGRDHPNALVAAAVISLPVSMMSLAGATVPLLIPACLYAAAAWRATRPPRD